MALEFKKVNIFEKWVGEAQNWNSWAWQVRNSLKKKQDFQEHIKLSDEEEIAFEGVNDLFRVQTTPYYLSLIDKNDPEDPIRKMFLPHTKEQSAKYQEMLDPLAEKKNSPVARIIHRYPDRCLFLATDFCSVYCRYCTRKHFTGKEKVFPSSSEYEEALAYIKSHSGIREVILSGGDPLSLSNKRLSKILSDLRSIPSVEIIRIGSRMPVVCPMRIDQELLDLLKINKPVYLMTHFNHPRELSLEAANALENLVDNGVPVFNQMVLLNGINNHPAIVQALSRRLLYLRVKPYYMFQCDPSEGTDHLRTSIQQSQEIQNELWGNVSGLMMPNYSIDLPGGGGKTSLGPNHLIKEEGSKHFFKGFDGIESQYISPNEAELTLPSDLENYSAEWEKLRNSKA
ncbi:MAG: KamA family radical SAM protein [Bdellovibrionales bacterium]